MDRLVRDADAILHAAAQTAVTTSTIDPETDFTSNALGTFRVLEAARRSRRQPTVIYCSTNKVYGANVNRVPILGRGPNRYDSASRTRGGFEETFGIDLCEHTPYGCSKLTGDLYVQDYRPSLRSARRRLPDVVHLRNASVRHGGPRAGWRGSSWPR